MREKALALMLASTAGLLAARRYYRNWGTTKLEAGAPMFGDGLIAEPAAESTSAEWIDAPVDAVWSRMLEVVGQKHPSEGNPSVGDVIQFPVTIRGRAVIGLSMSVVDVVDQRALVLRTVRSSAPVDMTWEWLAEPRWEDRTRLIVRLRIALRHPGDFAVAELAGPFAALVTRMTLVAIRSAAMTEGSAQKCSEAIDSRPSAPVDVAASR